MTPSTKFYVDESGNTGETLFVKNDFNFKDQPFYVLTGIIVVSEKEIELQNFVQYLKIKYSVLSGELKAKTLYSTKRFLITDLVEFLVKNKIPVFVELMDKSYYLNIQLVEYFLLPSYAFKISNELIQQKQFIVSNIGQFLNPEIYRRFVSTVKDYKNESLENFYEYLIAYFESLNSDEGAIFKESVEQTKADYFSAKADGTEYALKRFLPVPDLNPHNRLIHLLPNFNAFTNLIGRAERFRLANRLPSLSIIHDEQKQFDVIFESALENLKTSDIDNMLTGTKIQDTTTYKVGIQTKLTFQESHSDIFIQVADLISGFVMRFWSDLANSNFSNTDAYIRSISSLIYPKDNSSEGINFVVPDEDHFKLMNYNAFRTTDL